jgi:hypothetical protein
LDKSFQNVTLLLIVQKAFLNCEEVTAIANRSDLVFVLITIYKEELVEEEDLQTDGPSSVTTVLSFHRGQGPPPRAKKESVAKMTLEGLSYLASVSLNLLFL